MKLMLSPEAVTATGVGGSGAPGAAVSAAPPAAVQPPPPAAASAAAAAPPAQPAAAAPVKEVTYEALKLPEKSHMTPEALTAFKAYAKERGLSEAQAQAVLERDHSERASYMKSGMDELTRTDAEWKKSLETDKEFGNEKYGENAELVKRAFDYADPDGSFRKALEDAKLSNNPQLVKFVWKFGRMMAEDKLGAKASGQPSPKRNVEDSLYPTMMKKS